ncbi:hypothetical protein DCO58_00655 [Helicobacter saguini]|nr:hypothetical protein [Helicobacter saguini]MWV66231.1 hypothetical protein [Helicobacter saguini]MWV68582.1 hypothetical protein [Helicobacter saguini]
MPQDSIKPTQISYKTHFKITFLLKLLQYYLTGIALFFLTKIKILFKYKKVTILIAFILLTFSFYNNALHIVSPNDFKFWQKDTEASVVGKIIADIHHLDTQGFGLIYPIDYYPTPSQAMQIYEMLENNETPKTIGVYKSAIGLQGFIASYIYRHLNLDSLNLLYFLAAILCAFVITFSSILFAKIINRTFGIVFFATLFLSSGVVNYGNNLYHLYFAWFVPFIFTSLLYLRLQKIAKDSKITESNSQDSNNFDKQDSKHSKKMDFISQNSIDSKKTDSIKLDKTCVLLLALFTLSFTFRAACSYEYITSITLFAISPFLIAFCLTFWESKSKDSKKNTESNLQDSKINSKDSIESKTQDSKNLDSKTQTPTHHPFLEKDSKNSTQTSTLNTDSKILSLSQNPILEKTTLFKMIILLFALAIFGFSLCFIYHCYLRGDGSILQGLENIYKQDYLRRMIGGSASDFDPGYADSLNASVFKVISRYLLGDIYFIFSDVKALAFVLLLISVGILCVCAFKNRNIDSKKSAFSNKDFLDFKNTESTPSLDSKSPLDSKILDSKSTSFNIFSWFKRLFCLDSKDFSNDKNLDSKGFSIFALDLKEVRLCVVLIFVFALSPLSWYIMGKAHSYIHTHMNFILLYFGFIPTLFYVIILNILVGSKTESARF